MKWRIEGAHRDGTPAIFDVEADTAVEARRFAEGRNVIILGIDRAPDPAAATGNREKRGSEPPAYAGGGMSLRQWLPLACCVFFWRNSTQSNEQMAWVMAQGFVEERLKAPSTAKFGGESVTSLGEGRYSVSGWVDAQNSFGATLRTEFRCTVVDAGSGEWDLQSIEFEP